MLPHLPIRRTIYLTLVRELWLVRQPSLKIYQLQDAQYILVQQSQFFPGFDLNAIFEECMKDASQLGSGAIDKLSDRYPRQST